MALAVRLYVASYRFQPVILCREITLFLFALLWIGGQTRDTPSVYSLQLYIYIYSNYIYYIYIQCIMDRYEGNLPLTIPVHVPSICGRRSSLPKFMSSWMLTCTMEPLRPGCCSKHSKPGPILEGSNWSWKRHFSEILKFWWSLKHIKTPSMFSIV